MVAQSVNIQAAFLGIVLPESGAGARVSEVPDDQTSGDALFISLAL
jgi:hypothetical protein